MATKLNKKSNILYAGIEFVYEPVIWHANFSRSFIYIAFELHYLLKDLKETTLHHFLFVSLHQIRVKCSLVT